MGTTTARSCNETDALTLLVKSLAADGIEVGVPEAESARVWMEFRNKLAHMACPEGVVAVYGDFPRPLTTEQAKAIIKDGHKSFIKQNDHWLCVADRLSLDILDICEWLCQKVDECSSTKNIEGLGWLFNETSVVPEPPGTK